MAPKKPLPAREAARRKMPLDGADAQALEGALSLTERERDAARAEILKAQKALGNGVDDGVWRPGESAVDALIRALADADEDVARYRLQLEEIVELVGEGGDGSAFGSVESMLATFTLRQEVYQKQRDEARKYAEERNDEANKLQRLLNMAAQERDEARAALTDDTRLAEWEKRGVVDSAVIAKLREARAEVALLKNHYSLDAASKLRAEVAAARSLTALREHERDEAREKLKQLEAWRDGLQEYLLNWRGVALGEECYACGGSGVRSYPNTTMWRGGYGGQATTSGVCDGCWGSGGGVSKGWVNLRVLESKLDRMARMDKLVAAVLESAESAPPGGTLEKLVQLAQSLKQDPNLP